MSFYDQENDRDRRLGAALRALPVPEHDDGFWTDLEAGLEELGERPRVALGRDPAEEPRVLATPEEVRTSAAATRRATPARRRQPRFPGARARARDRRRVAPAAGPRPTRVPRLVRRSRRMPVVVVPASPATLAGPGRPGARWRGRPGLGASARHRHRLRLRPGALAVVVLVAALSAAAWAWWPDRSGDADGTATPAPTGGRATTTAPGVAGAPVPAWAGELVRTRVDEDGDATITRYSVHAQADGAIRVASLDDDDPTDLGEDPSIGVRVEVDDDGAVRTTGLAPVPLGEEGADSLLHRHDAELVAALAAAGDGRVTTATVDGRAVWRATLGGVELAVDQALRVPLRRVQPDADGGRDEVTVTVADDVPPTPPGLPGSEAGAGGVATPGPWRPATVATARLVATGLPAGYEVAAAAVADEAPGGGPESANPVGRASQVVYRRGWEQVVVTTWATGPDPAAWADPMAVPDVDPAATTSLTVPAGALAGARAQVVLAPGASPHLWAVGPDHVVVVSGPLAPDELLAVAASLAPSP